jgi:DNA invertase Pin-like site-specific DNA recombinase
MKAALYCHVSTEEQGKSGYSLRQQIEALRRYCDAHDLEVVGEFEDRVSGASLDRLGLDALRDAVSAGGVDAVLAQDRDRFSREPAHVYILREEFREHGATLRSLNDRGDNSPEGELTDGFLDQLAKFERAKTVERTRRGRTTIRNIILSDPYLGTFWWGKEKRTATTVSVVENGVRTYRKKVKREERPREEWTAIPVPDSGIPPETVARARENSKGNAWNPSRNSNRIWELSGGTGLCGYCGSRLKTHTSSTPQRPSTSTTCAPRGRPTGTTAPAPTRSTTEQRSWNCWSGIPL